MEGRFFTLVLLLLSIISSSTADVSQNIAEKTCSSSVCIPENYKKLDLPSNDIVVVNTSLFLMDIYRIDHQTYTFHLNFVLKLKWFDNRINITSKDKEEVIDADFLKHLWKPDLYLWDSKDGMARSDATVKSGARVIRSGKDILVKFTIETEAETICRMNFTFYPFNTNTCFLKVSSFGHFNDSVVFSTAGSQPPDIFLDPRKIQLYDVALSYMQDLEESWDTNGKFYSTAGIKMVLKYKPEKCLLVYFLPTSMFTITSWFSFLLPPTSYPARTSLLVTIFLCQIGIFNTVVQDTPNENGGLTALEVWVLSNIYLVFLTFLAYVVLLARIRLEPIREVVPQKNKMDPRKEEGADERKMTALEIWLFLAVAVGTLLFLVIFFLYYLTDNNN